MRPFLLALLPCLALASAAAAECAGGEQVFACQIGKKSLELCRIGDDLTYAFGPPGSPDLTISESLTTVNFTPWPGVGSAIWENVVFVNEGFAYEVWTSQERNAEEDTPLEAGINVLNGEELVAELRCDEGTPSQALEGIWDLKESVGLCWEFDSQSWKTTCNNG